MIKNNLVGQYQAIDNKGRSTPDLLMLVHDKAVKHLIAARNFHITQDYTARGQEILKVVHIFSALEQVFSLNEGSENMPDMRKMYQILCYNVENLISSRAGAEQYDDWIKYIENIRAFWANLALLTTKTSEPAEPNSDMEQKQHISTHYAILV